MIIIDVSPVPRRRDLRRIRFDTGLTLDVFEEIYTRFALVRGRDLDREALAEVTRADRLLGARTAAMHFLRPRMRTRHEIAERLRAKHYDDQAIAAALLFLEGYGMIDDAAYASSYVNDRLLKRPVGRRRLEAELLARGVDRNTVEDVLSRIDADSEIQQARLAARSKRRSLDRANRYKRERSLVAFLTGRGFSWEVIQRVVDEDRTEHDATREDSDDR